MPGDLFLHVFDRSKTACLVILAVLLVRLLLRRAPKVLSYALWAVVLVRLLVPFSLEAPVGLIPKGAPTADSYALGQADIGPREAAAAAIDAISSMMNGRVGVQHITTQELDIYGHRNYVTVNWWEIWAFLAGWIWPVGVAVMALHGVRSYARLRRSLVGAAKAAEGVYLADHIDTPFVLGLVRPTIYLPSDLEPEEQAYILLHERHHIRRGDHVTRLLAYGALCIHWFNPLVWVAFWLSGRDMEMSCDEAVVGKLGGQIRADYAQSLLRLATEEPSVAAMPLGFGEGCCGSRIRNLAKWKQPALWAVLLGSCLCILLTGCLLADRPEQRATGGVDHRQVYQVEQLLYEAPNYSFSLVPGANTSDYYVKEDFFLWEYDDKNGWRALGQLEELSLTHDNFEVLFVDRLMGDVSPTQLRRDNRRAWRLITDEGVLYDLLAQRSGAVYLAQGYASDSDTPQSIRWLMELEADRSAELPLALSQPDGLNQVELLLPFGSDARAMKDGKPVEGQYHASRYRAGEYDPLWLWSYTFLDTTVFEGGQDTAAALIEAGKNPGLGVRALHSRGITGAGVGVAVIDENEVHVTTEIADSLTDAASIYPAGGRKEGTGQGAALASLLVGNTVGTAPGADLYYYDTVLGNEAAALRHILSVNEKLPPAERIRVVVAPTVQLCEGFDEPAWDALVDRAAAAGILVLDGRENNRTGFVQAGFYELNSPEDIALCKPGRPGNTGVSSQYGVLYAPGANRTVMESLQPGEDHWRYEGMGCRSWALAYVGGVAAMGFQVCPGMSSGQCRELLLETAAKSGYDTGEGQFDAYFVDPAAFVAAAEQLATAKPTVKK